MSWMEFNQNSAEFFLELSELLEAQCDIEQENARTCEAEELQNLQRSEEPENFRTSELHYSES